MGSHRADRRGHSAVEPAPVAAAVTRPGGRRKAEPVKRRGPLPGAPALVGAVAVLAAGVGAVGLDGGGAALAGAHVSPNNGTDAFAFAGNAGRQRAVSRDTDRQAIAASSKSTLKAEAEAMGQQRNAALTSLAHSAEKRADQIAKNLWILPTTGYHLTGRFGMVSGLWATFHTGLDFATATGTPIYAIADGVITSTGYDGPYGNKTVETLADGTEIWYAHQSAIGVHAGEEVHQGEQIGNVGSTGNTTGPHVHIEVRPGGGDPVDPYPAFIEHGVTP